MHKWPIKLIFVFAFLLLSFGIENVSANSYVFYNQNSILPGDSLGNSTTTSRTFLSSSTPLSVGQFATGTKITLFASGEMSQSGVASTASWYYSFVLGTKAICGGDTQATTLSGIMNGATWAIRCDLQITNTGSYGQQTKTSYNFSANLTTGNSAVQSFDPASTTPFLIRVQSDATNKSTSTLKSFSIIVTDNSTSTSDMSTSTIIIAEGSFDPLIMALGFILFFIVMFGFMFYFGRRKGVKK